MYVNENAGVIIPNPSQIVWEGRVVTSAELVFDKDTAKVEPLEALVIKTKNSIFFKRTYHAPGIAYSEPEIEVSLFSKESFYKDAPFMESVSDVTREKIYNAMRKLGSLQVRFDKAANTLETVGESWDAESSEDEDEVITSMRQMAVNSDASIKKLLSNFNKKVVSESSVNESEWLSISEMRNLDVWDENVNRAFTALFHDQEIPEIVKRDEPKEIELEESETVMPEVPSEELEEKWYETAADAQEAFEPAVNENVDESRID